ncbi:MAG: hypothetical protein H0X25_11285 [Acidobacteriales bacterium]|nr:hypothetical protein [Terriglobales bacterium]
MFARLEFVHTPHRKEDFLEKVRHEILPILKAQRGFIDLIPFVPESNMEFGRVEKLISISLWADKWDAEKYEQDVFPLVQEILKPFITKPITIKAYTVDAALSEHLAKALAA